MSLISTYQGRKTLFAQKLTSKGVSASETDGLTTLINKIDNIETGFIDGILLVGDKDIIQTGNNCRLVAVAVQNGKVVDETVTLYSLKNRFSNPLTENTNGFTLSSDGNLTPSANGAIVSGTVRYTPQLHEQTENFTVRFKCKTLNEGNVAFLGGMVTSDGNHDNFTRLWLATDYQEFMEESFTLPSGTDLTEWTDIKIEYTPTEQKLYIDGTLVATAVIDMTDTSYWSGYDYFGFTEFGDYMIKDFSLTLNEIARASGTGAVIYDYTGVGAGMVEFYAICEL